MASSSSSIHFSVDDKDLDDAELWAVIDSAAASHSSSKSRKPLALKYTNLQNTSPVPNLSPVPKFSRNPKNQRTIDEDVRVSADGEVLQEPWMHQRPLKISRSCGSGFNEDNRIVVIKNPQRTPPTPSSYSSPDPGRFSVQEISPGMENSSLYSFRKGENKENMRHSLSGQFPSVTLFKQYQDAAMAILEKTDYTIISGNTFIKKSGWRKISFYFNLSFEIKDKSIEFDENRNVQRAEFVVRAFMQGGRFSDGWGSCERREKRFLKPNHDIPSTAETRAKNRACQDLLGIGEYRRGLT